MKRMVLFLVISIILITSTQTTFVAAPEKPSHSIEQRIPDAAIRLRILAHSDQDKDQQIKYAVRDRVNAYIERAVAHIDNQKEARLTIEASIPALKEIIADTLTDYEQTYDFQISFKEDVPFPLKTYGPYVYPAGEYEAVLITLGDGHGKNWWCVLFPPLCFIDFFNDQTVVDAEAQQKHEEDAAEVPEEDVEVKFFLFDLFNFS